MVVTVSLTVCISLYTCAWRHGNTCVQWVHVLYSRGVFCMKVADLAAWTKWAQSRRYSRPGSITHVPGTSWWVCVGPELERGLGSSSPVAISFKLWSQQLSNVFYRLKEAMRIDCGAWGVLIIKVNEDSECLTVPTCARLNYSLVCVCVCVGVGVGEVRLGTIARSWV